MTRQCDLCGVAYEAVRKDSRYCSDTCGKRARLGQPASGLGPTGGRGVVSEMGPIEQRVHADLAALMTSHPMGEALSAMALALAVSLDRGAGMQEAAVNRELRATLDDLARMKVGDDDELDSLLSAPTVGSDVSAEVRDTEDS